MQKMVLEPKNWSGRPFLVADHFLCDRTCEATAAIMKKFQYESISMWRKRFKLLELRICASFRQPALQYSCIATPSCKGRGLETSPYHIVIQFNPHARTIDTMAIVETVLAAAVEAAKRLGLFKRLSTISI